MATPDADIFSPLSEADQAAWPDVGPEERARLQRQFTLMEGHPSAPMILVTRDAHRTWRVSPINTPFGRACYIIGATVRDLGLAVVEWILAHASSEELDTLARISEAAWDPNALRPGDAKHLEALANRLPRKIDATRGESGEQ